MLSDENAASVYRCELLNAQRRMGLMGGEKGNLERYRNRERNEGLELPAIISQTRWTACNGYRHPQASKALHDSPAPNVHEGYVRQPYKGKDLCLGGGLVGTPKNQGVDQVKDREGPAGSCSPSSQQGKEAIPSK